MNKINKFLILFLLFFVVLLWGAWEFIQSERFSSILVTRVAKKIEEATDGKLKFSRIEFQLFPPATLIKNLEIEYTNEALKTTVEMEAANLGLYFNILDVFSSTFKVQKIKINDGLSKVRVQDLTIDKKFFQNLFDKKDNSNEMIKIKDVFDAYSKIYHFQKKIVVNNLEIDNLKLILNESSLFIDRLKIVPKEKHLGLNINLTAIDLFPPEIHSLDLNFDQLLVNASLEEQNVEIDNILIKNKHSSMTGTILFGQKKNKNIVNSELSISGPLKEFLNYLPYNPNFETIEGFANINILAKGDLENLNAQANINLDKFSSHWAKSQKAELKIYKHNQVLGIDEIYLFDDGGTLKAKGAKDIYNILDKKFIYGNSDLLFENLHTGTFLHYLRKSLAPFKGKFTGVINTSWSSDGLLFSTKGATEVEDLMLIFPNAKHAIIINPHLNLLDLKLNVSWPGKINIESKINFPGNNLFIQGQLYNDYAAFKLSADKFDFKTFGPISGVNFGGNGFMNLDVNGPMDNVEFKFKMGLDDFRLIDINFGKVIGDFTFILRDSKLILHNLEGDIKNAKYSGRGEFNFGDNGEFELDFDLHKSNLQNLSIMLPALFKKMTFLPEDLDFTATSKLKFSGGYSLEELVVEGSMNFKNLYFWGEDFDQMSMNVNFANKNVNLNNIAMAKSACRGLGNVLFDMNNEILDMGFGFKRAKLSEFNFYKSAGLGYDGEAEGEYSSRGHISSLENRGFVKTTYATLAHRPAPGSEISYSSKNSKLKFDGKFLGDMFQVASVLDVSGAKEKNSSLNVKIETNEILNLMGLLSEHNISEKELEGEILLNANAKFSLENLSNLDFELNLSKFSLFTDKIFFSLNQATILEINNGQIKDWNFDWRGKSIELSSKGSGNFSDKINILTSFKIDPSIIELITDKLQFLSGVLEGNVNLTTDSQKILTSSNIRGTDLTFRSLNIPSQFNNINFSMDGVNKNFYLQYMKGNYAGGKVLSSGDIIFKFPSPRLNLDISLEGVNIPVLKKSNFIADSKTNLQGDGIPYLLTGFVNLVHANIIDEFSEFSKNKKNNAGGSRFVPEISQEENRKIIKYNFDLNILRPINVKNNIADFKVNGQFNFQGHDDNPLLKGEMNIVPGMSKFVFKNNEFTLDEGKLTFLGEQKDNNPTFKFLGSTVVNDYFVKMDFSGRPSSFNLNFTSDPLLSQEDIVSLLTVGLTLDKSKGLNSNELQSVTSIGLGSLLLDQFGINQGLKSSLGLKLSVLPYYQKSQVSPINSSTSSGDLSTSRLRSATRLRVEKKINKKMEMSVSSTVGGNTEQNRAMNLDYNISKGYSLKGVYEVRSSTGSETKENSNSMGMDFIFRRTFK